jgi:hypothetical protein
VKSADAMAALAARVEDRRPVKAPERDTFAEFLTQDARVPTGRGEYGPYSFAGREALHGVVSVLDRIIGEQLRDARVTLAGGAQFGKTILELNLLAYLTGQRWRNAGLYLPDDDLVQGIVDTKFRPDVLDQIGWFAELTQVGKSVLKSGKQVNRKGAFLVTDGRRMANGMIRGLGKVPTSFSMDVAAMDEVDDIEPRMEKFVEGRLTASDLRLIVKIGTQRVHGRGQQKAWEEGSQGVVMLDCPRCRKAWNPEENFPQIVRCRKPGNPQLTYSGDFRRGDEVVCGHDPSNEYFLACPDCGAGLDPRSPRWQHRRPERLRLYNWSFRLSQLGIGAIDLSQVVRAWGEALKDEEKMVVFRCDRLALPKSSAQAVTPDILDRARQVEVFDLAPPVIEGGSRVAGLDMGDRCWLFGRERLPSGLRRCVVAEQIPAAQVVGRVEALAIIHQLSAVFVDERPLVNESRQIALRLNGLHLVERWPKQVDLERPDAHASFPGGLVWDGRAGRWRNLKAAVVRFSKQKLGSGVAHGMVWFEDGDGVNKCVPVIECNRFETIDAVVREFLTPAEGVTEIINGTIRQEPAMLLPRRQTGSPPILEILDGHLIAGSEREKEPGGQLGDYVDQCDNHLLLADGYSRLAEQHAGSASAASPFRYEGVNTGRSSRGRRVA